MTNRDNRLYFIENKIAVNFQVRELTEVRNALEQIKSGGFPERFASEEVYLIGKLFSSQNKLAFDWRKI